MRRNRPCGGLPALCALLVMGWLAAACGDEFCENGNATPDASLAECESAADCEDGDPCTQNLCNEEAGHCVHPPRDLDGDGTGDASCGGWDCDDGDPEIYPGALERCNGRDDDCDGALRDDEVDGDGDGFVPCGADGPASADCDDTNDRVHPGAREICGNGADDNCNGLVDGQDLACVEPPPHDICVSAAALTVPGNVLASTAAAANDYVGSCGGVAPDLVYFFDVAGLAAITLRLDTLDPGYNPHLHLRRECDTAGSEIACEDDTDGLVPIINLRAPPSGRYYLFVDGAAPYDVGDFDLQASATPVLNDLCADAVDVSLGGVWHSTTADKSNHYTASCGGATGPEAVFMFTLNQTRHVLLDLQGSAMSYSTLVLQTVCGDPASEIACVYDAGGFSPGFFDGHLDPGTYYVIVDSYSASYVGAYTLAVSFSG